MKDAQVVCLCVFVLVVPALHAQTAGAPVDASSVWNALQSPVMDPSKSANTENVEIVRDRIHITLKSGTIQFAQPVNGVVFAAVFRGEGRVQCDPPNPIEAHQLRLFTKQDKLDMTFTEAVLTFTDALFDEVAKEVKWASGGATDELYAKRQHEHEDLGAQHLARLFKSILSGNHNRTGYLVADLKTKEKDWMEIAYNAMDEEEFSIGRWVDVGPVKRFDIWMAFPANGRNPREAYADPTARADYLIAGYQIEAEVTADAYLRATARVNVQPRYSGERALLFALDSNLRVSSIKDAQGRELKFFQPPERKDRYQSYGNYVAVALQTPTEANAVQKLEFHYGGKRAVRKVGDGNYFCESFGWYPAFFGSGTGTDTFAFRSDFDLTFRSPKEFGIVATGHKESETVDGNVRVTSWKSDIPLAVAGFAFGDYKVYSERVGDVDVQVYANKRPDDLLKAIQRRFDNPLGDFVPQGRSPESMLSSSRPPTPDRRPQAVIGNLSAAALDQVIGVETSNTLRVFQLYFGPYPYKQIAVTNIMGSYGQGWPGLLYLGWFTFLDATQRNALGMKGQTELSDFFRAHESSHQWWGHRVGWKSYHDQWLSEGFASFSGNLYVQYRQNWREALSRWRKEKENLHTQDEKGHAVESLGPIWLGHRIASSETNPSSYQFLIYSKGAYVLYMLRMMLYDTLSPDPDHDFKELMQDYCRTFENKPASTEDFAAVVARHMIRTMDLDRNHKMDWFFNQYVYGTGIPEYRLSYTTEPAGDGKIKLSGTLTRSGVPDTWKDVVALYAHQGQNVTRMGFIIATQAVTPFEATLPASFDRFSINDNEDLLADVKQ